MHYYFTQTAKIAQSGHTYLMQRDLEAFVRCFDDDVSSKFLANHLRLFLLLNKKARLFCARISTTFSSTKRSILTFCFKILYFSLLAHWLGCMPNHGNDLGSNPLLGIYIRKQVEVEESYNELKTNQCWAKTNNKNVKNSKEPYRRTVKRILLSALAQLCRCSS